MALSTIAFIFGVTGVWLTIRQTIWCWPVSLVAVIASVAEFYKEQLFGDMCLQIFYFFAGIYGWYFWGKNKNLLFHVQHFKIKKLPILLFATVIQTVIYYYLLIYFKGDKPILDSILTACSLTVTYMMTKKWLENWIAWVVIDLFYVSLYVIKDMWLFAALNLFMAIVAFYGWLKWRKLV